MTDKKLTDNEIIKALECHTGNNSKRCQVCPYTIYGCYCLDHLHPDLLDLINRQKAEIEKLEKENTVFREIIKKQDDEISALRKDLLKRENLEESFSKSVKQFDKRLEKTVKLERAEAYKEFTEKFKEKISQKVCCGRLSFVETEYELNNLLKEMEDKNNE